LARLCIGRKIDEIIESLKGIPCKGNTSCPDQLSRALESYKKKKADEAAAAAAEATA